MSHLHSPRPRCPYGVHSCKTNPIPALPGRKRLGGRASAGCCTNKANWPQMGRKTIAKATGLDAPPVTIVSAPNKANPGEAGVGRGLGDAGPSGRCTNKPNLPQTSREDHRQEPALSTANGPEALTLPPVTRLSAPNEANLARRQGCTGAGKVVGPAPSAANRAKRSQFALGEQAGTTRQSCKTKPIFRRDKMAIRACVKRSYESHGQGGDREKQSQFLPASAPPGGTGPEGPL